MKTRKGFVSNSSSASFVVSLDRLTALQFAKLQQWCADSDWTCTVDLVSGTASGYTSMDNASIEDFLEREHINNNPVRVTSN
jgi:hypothetical protein